MDAPMPPGEKDDEHPNIEGGMDCQRRSIRQLHLCPSPKFYTSFRVHFSVQPGIEFSRIDDESMVGSLGYLVDAVISND